MEIGNLLEFQTKKEHTIFPNFYFASKRFFLYTQFDFASFQNLILCRLILYIRKTAQAIKTHYQSKNRTNLLVFSSVVIPSPLTCANTLTLDYKTAKKKSSNPKSRISKSLNKETWRRRRRKDPVPAAPTCGLAVTWRAEWENRGGWSQPSAPDTSALSLTWRREACGSHTGTGVQAEECRRQGGRKKIQAKKRAD